MLSLGLFSPVWAVGAVGATALLVPLTHVIKTEDRTPASADTVRTGQVIGAHYFGIRGAELGGMC